MAATSQINDWIRATAPDTISKVFREMTAVSRWMAIADVFATARYQDMLFALQDRQRVDAAAARGFVLRAAEAWLSAQAVLRTSAIPDWQAPKDWRDELAGEIDTYRSKVAGWDGYSASPIHAEAIEDAIKFIRSLPLDILPPIDQPCADGEVSLVWRIGRKFAEIAFTGDSMFSWYATNGYEERAGEDLPLESGLPADLEQIMAIGRHRTASVTTSFAPPEPWLPVDIEYATDIINEGQESIITSAAPSNLWPASDLDWNPGPGAESSSSHLLGQLEAA